jgi:single-stranded-DNA-specific exonuclease
MVISNKANSENLAAPRWDMGAALPVEIDQALQQYPDYLRHIFFNRGILDTAEAESFLAARSPYTTDPFLLTGMAAAVQRLEQAVQGHEKVAVYGDYDVDGVTAAVLMVEVLRAAGADVQVKIPNRFEEGYGLNNEAIQKLAEDGVRLIVTVDCGARSPREADLGRSLGIDMIISDHHQPGAELPNVLALINPRQPGDPYPDKDLAGVGLAYKLAEGYLKQHVIHEVSAEQWLDLVALGTVADMAPLTGENRALVTKGLQQIRAQTRQGLSSLAGAANLEIKRTTARDIGFVLAPRLNAAGRLESAQAAFDLLTTHDFNQAGKLAQELGNQNYERQRLTKEIQQQAAEIALKDNSQALLLFAVHADFNEGVIGLAAARLVDTYYRPAIVACKGIETTRGSCRSIPEFHITEALDQCTELLVRHGGHKAAAGFTVRNENLDALVARLQAIALEQLGKLELRPVLKADCEFPLEQLGSSSTETLFAYLEKLEPTGMGNPEPVFMAKNLAVKKSKPVGKDGSHLQLTILDAYGALHDAIAFRQSQWMQNMPTRVDLLYTLEKDEYYGTPRVKLNIKGIRPTRQS